MNHAVSIVGLYLKRPEIALRHARTAARLFFGGNLGELKRRLSALGGTMHARHRLHAERSGAVRSLAKLKRNAKRNSAAILADLRPLAPDCPGLENARDDLERVRLLQRHLLLRHCLFDEHYYRSTYLRGADDQAPVDHYLRTGLKSGFRPNAYFDPVEYLMLYPEVAGHGMDPVLYYTFFGWRDGQRAGSHFDAEFYVAANPDVAETGVSPFLHFMEEGRAMGCLPKSTSRPDGLAADRGTILLVSHDAHLGGAQRVAQVFAEWLVASTKFDVRIVIVNGGPYIDDFRRIADVFDLEDERSKSNAKRLAAKLRDFAGPDVKAVFLNSAVSGAFLRYWDEDTPVLAYIHELPKMLQSLDAEMRLIRERATRVIGGSGAVQDALEQYGIEHDRLCNVHAFVPPLPAETVDKAEGKATLDIPAKDFVVVACGVLHWRKSPETFIAVAERLAAAGKENVRFIWVGGGPDEEACRKLIETKGLADRVTITGYDLDIMRYLRAADLFLLTSEEDPFPLVCLNAASASVPVVCFDEAGGMPEFVARGCGRSVPFMDDAAMAQAVLDYMADEESRAEHGAAARDTVASEFTVKTVGPRLLHHIREAADIRPYLSVVVPNYNYEDYLPERLETIADQTFQDFEVILLDDVSSDGSVALLEAFARKRPGTRVVVNEQNSGAPSGQWLKGMAMANAELVWVAEADDSCKPELLARLLPYFEDRNVFLGYVKSVPIGPNGEVYGDYETSYLNRISNGRWSQSHVATDHEEANQGLGIANCIPNASSAVFRRFEPETEFADTVRSMRLCGDWYFYLHAMRGGLVAYWNDELNLHRRHPQTVTQTTEGTTRYFDEFATVRDYVGRHYRLGSEARAAIRRFTIEDLDRFGVKDGALRERALTTASMRGAHKTSPALLVVVSDLSPGGGQMFGIRLANAWAARGRRAVLLNARRFPDHAEVVANINARVALYHADTMEMDFGELVSRFDIDVVHSSIWWADRYVHENIGETPDLPWVITMHGCYETILDNPQTDMSFGTRLPDMLKRVNAWVYTAEKNRRVFAKFGEPSRLENILNGFEPENTVTRSREEFGLREEAIVLCLATRAIEEKGWFEAVEMTKKLNAKGIATDLMLIGEGPVADAIARQAPDHVHLYGQVSNLGGYIEAADIGILPSYFAGESMPLVLLEMMVRGKPVIATDTGEIGMMIGDGNNAGGIIVPLTQGRVDIEGFVDAIELLRDESLREDYGKRSAARFEEAFTMDKMLGSYCDLYESVIGR